MAPPLLSLRDAAIGFGGPPLFEGLTLHVARGDIACLVGRNGCGKSTLLKLIARELDPDAGERYAEPGLTVAYLAQEPAMQAGTSVFDWISADIAEGRPQEVHPRHIVEAALSLFQLDGRRDVASLSGGEQRRAALAQVFADPPDLLAARRADQPSGYRDHPVARRCRAEIPGRGAGREPRPHLPCQRHQQHPVAGERPPAPDRPGLRRVRRLVRAGAERRGARGTAARFAAAGRKRAGCCAA